MATPTACKTKRRRRSKSGSPSQPRSVKDIAAKFDKVVTHKKSNVKSTTSRQRRASSVYRSKRRELNKALIAQQDATHNALTVKLRPASPNTKQPPQEHTYDFSLKHIRSKRMKDSSTDELDIAAAELTPYELLQSVIADHDYELSNDDEYDALILDEPVSDLCNKDHEEANNASNQEVDEDDGYGSCRRVSNTSTLISASDSESEVVGCDFTEPLSAMPAAATSKLVYHTDSVLRTSSTARPQRLAVADPAEEASSSGLSDDDADDYFYAQQQEQCVQYDTDSMYGGSICIEAGKDDGARDSVAASETETERVEDEVDVETDIGGEERDDADTNHSVGDGFDDRARRHVQHLAQSEFDADTNEMKTITDSVVVEIDKVRLTKHSRSRPETPLILSRKSENEESEQEEKVDIEAKKKKAKTRSLSAAFAPSDLALLGVGKISYKDYLVKHLSQDALAKIEKRKQSTAVKQNLKASASSSGEYSYNYNYNYGDSLYPDLSDEEYFSKTEEGSYYSSSGSYSDSSYTASDGTDDEDNAQTNKAYIDRNKLNEIHVERDEDASHCFEAADDEETPETPIPADSAIEIARRGDDGDTQQQQPCIVKPNVMLLIDTDSEDEDDHNAYNTAQSDYKSIPQFQPNTPTLTRPPQPFETESTSESEADTEESDSEEEEDAISDLDGGCRVRINDVLYELNLFGLSLLFMAMKIVYVDQLLSLHPSRVLCDENKQHNIQMTANLYRFAKYISRCLSNSKFAFDGVYKQQWMEIESNAFRNIYGTPSTDMITFESLSRHQAPFAFDAADTIQLRGYDRSGFSAKLPSAECTTKTISVNVQQLADAYRFECSLFKLQLRIGDTEYCINDRLSIYKNGVYCTQLLCRDQFVENGSILNIEMRRNQLQQIEISFCHIPRNTAERTHVSRCFTIDSPEKDEFQCHIEQYRGSGIYAIAH